jgi:hypothetical protein
MALRQLEWPEFRNQIDEVAEDGLNGNALNNCGAAAAGMVAHYITGVRMSSDYIVTWMRGPDYRGVLYDYDLTEFLTSACTIPTKTYREIDAETARGVALACIGDGRPALALIQWREWNRWLNHWVVVIGDDDGLWVAGCPHR